MRKIHLIISFASVLLTAVAGATEPGLVLHFPMNEGSGNVLHDSS